MTFDELKALLVEWYEAGRAVNAGSMVGVDAWMDVNFRLKTYARALYEGRGEAEGVSHVLGIGDGVATTFRCSEEVESLDKKAGIVRLKNVVGAEVTE